MRADEIKTKLNSPSLTDRRWFLQATCAVTGQGLQDGMQWLASQFKIRHGHGEIKKSKKAT